jgi:uncharacterized membrane protein
MGPRIERIDTPPPPARGPLLMDAELAPSQSLRPRTFLILFCILAAALACLSLVFVAQGLWPVAGFLGLDLLLVWIAFRISYRNARLREHVQVSAERVHVWREVPGKPTQHFVVSPTWARVELSGEGMDPRGLRLTAGGRRLVLASFLSPPERRAFADALGQALRAASRATASP